MRSASIQRTSVPLRHALVGLMPASARCGLCSCSSIFFRHAYGKRSKAANRHQRLSGTHQCNFHGGLVARREAYRFRWQ
jgi:hypothetical protein